MTHIAIVEDDPACAEELRGYIHRYSRETGEAVEITCFSDGLDLVEDYRPVYNLILMDIEMPHMDGMTAAEKLREADKTVLLMFITNMAQYAIRGYQVDALDYVLKPVGYYAFAIKLKKAMRMIRGREGRQLFLARDGGVERVSSADIHFIEVADHRLRYCTDQGEYTATGTLRDLEQALEGEPFVRCNSCYLVNLRHVTGVKQDIAKMGCHPLKISRPKRRGFLQAMSDYYGGGGR